MTLLIRHSEKKGTTVVHDGGTTAVLDPGDNGALLAWDDTHHSDKWPGAFPCTPSFYLPVSKGLTGIANMKDQVVRRLHHIRTLVVEDQFLGRNPDVMINIVFSAGVASGVIASVVKVDRIVLVKPATWQAWLPKDDGPRKGSGKRRALAYAEKHVPEAIGAIGTKARRQGFADALGMAGWFIQGCQP